MTTLTGASERIGKLLCATLCALLSASVVSGPLSSHDIDRAAQDGGLLALYATCTESIHDQICAGPPTAPEIKNLLTHYFKVFLPLSATAHSAWYVATARPAPFPGPLQEGIAVGPDGLLLAGYAVNAELYRLREAQRY